MNTSQSSGLSSSTVVSDAQITLGVFLRSRRERMTPTQSMQRVRRRTPGLRREEVADRAQISSEWYTYLEQDRGIRPSTAVLARIADALELNWAEREYMSALAYPRANVAPPTSELPLGLRAYIDDLEYRPAYVVNTLWDIVGWNHAAAKVFPIVQLQATNETPNLVKAVFLSNDWRMLYANWELHARKMMAIFRLTVARQADHPRCKVLVNELKKGSQDFSTWWKEQDVAVSTSGVKELIHPIVGLLTVNYTGFNTMDEPELTVISFSPANPLSKKSLQTLFSVSSDELY
jgi:transcriptional regulator with XRE-family HTH domain